MIADSISPARHRLTTVEAKFPRQILAEVNTHRALSRNSASSRAVPVRKMLDQVRTDPFIPLKWQSAQPGMQGGEELDEQDSIEAEHEWLNARDAAVEQAEALLHLGVHKTMPNRLLEPFAWHTAILSATDAGWTNFFNQRCEAGAEIHMQTLAHEILRAMRRSEPEVVKVGGWHLPYVTRADREYHGYGTQVLCQLSAARCARVSYLTHDGQHSEHADLQLYNKLTSARPPHWSPLEHPARAAVAGERTLGNFDGWHQLRHLVQSV